MLGSAVPLHLAQVETDAIRLWRLLNETGADVRWAVWVGAWPTVVAAVVGGMWLAGDGRGMMGMWGRLAMRVVGRRSGWAAAVPVVLGVGVPLVLFAISLHERASLWTFWRLQGEGVRSSVADRGDGGAAGRVHHAVRGGGLGGARRLVGVCVGVLLVSRAAAGVLVGSGTLAAWSWIGATG
ncbi:MAG: hypothetical protein R3B68_02080 [Phycisphaerales bacterium]